MSTHNICFCVEIQISALFCQKKTHTHTKKKMPYLELSKNPCSLSIAYFLGYMAIQKAVPSLCSDFFYLCIPSPVLTFFALELTF